MFEKTRSMYLSSTITYFFLPLVLAIPKGYPLSSFERLTNPFSYAIWLMFGFSFLVGILVIVGVKSFRRLDIAAFLFGKFNNFPLANLFNTLLGGSLISPAPRRNFARYILALWLLYTMVIRNAYTGKMYTLLQDSKLKTSFKTVQQLVENGFTIYYAKVLKGTLQSMVSSSANIQEWNFDAFPSKVVLYWLNQNATKSAYFTLKEIVLNYNRELNSTSHEVSILSQEIANFPVTMYLPQNSYLKKSIDVKITQILTGGMIGNWEHFYCSTKNRLQQNQEPTVLTLWLLSGIFILYIIFIIICIVVFILELFSIKYVKIRNFFHIFNI